MVRLTEMDDPYSFQSTVKGLYIYDDNEDDSDSEKDAEFLLVS
jgi:hypothetical protein